MDAITNTTHKVIGTLRSNTWVDVPVMHNATETIHDHMEDVVACVCCGVSGSGVNDWTEVE